MLNKTAWLWMQRAVVAVGILAYLARAARLPFAPTLVMCALAGFAAVAILGLLIKQLHRWKWISALPWEEKPPVAMVSALVQRAPIVEHNQDSALGNRVRPVAVTWTMSKGLRPTGCVPFAGTFVLGGNA